MSKNTIIAVIAAILIGVGVAVIAAQLNDSDAPVPDEATTSEDNQSPLLNGNDGQGAGEAVQEDTVTYTDAGFSPAVITVQAGQTVTFENSSSDRMWVASDPHPSHTDLPEFNAQRGVDQGETYSFTFEESGEWGYHDHLQSGNTGTVIVE